MTTEGVKPYYQAKIEECELVINEKSQDLRRLEAQRNALNAKGITTTAIILCRIQSDHRVNASIQISPPVEGRTAAPSGTRLLRRRGRQSDGQEKSARQGNRYRTVRL